MQGTLISTLYASRCNGPSKKSVSFVINFLKGIILFRLPDIKGATKGEKTFLNSKLDFEN